jgi:cathepsin X
MEGHTLRNDYELPMPHEYVDAAALPADFSWLNVNGTSFVTRMLNQHIPQYCGSCWAHGAVSALQDRVKIMRHQQGLTLGPDVYLSIQHILNCATDVAGSCHGGSATGVYDFITHHAKDKNIPFETCQPYLACSSESTEGFCGSIPDKTSCTAANTCVTCNTFSGFPMKGKCKAIMEYPNCTIAEYGELPTDADAIKAEVFARGPVPAGVNAEAMLEYDGGIMDEAYCTNGKYDDGVNHIVSIVGLKTDPATKLQYWIVRNSWGTYWGDMGFFYLELGKNLLGIESEVSWATPGRCTERNFPCDEDGKNCDGETTSSTYSTYVDPSVNMEALERRLQMVADEVAAADQTNE